MSTPVTPIERAPAAVARKFGVRPGKRFKVLSFADVLTQPDPKWLVQGVLPSNGLVTLYGPPNIGKTFVALDLALAVASGQPWVGQATILGDVLYVVAEGVAGFKKRLTAGASARGLGNAVTNRIHFIDEPVQLHSPADIDAFLISVSAQIAEPISLVIFDTLSRCFVGGEENSAKDVGKLIEGADRVRKQTGATVLLVHHTTKDGNSERGSSALRGSADAMLEVSASKGVVLLECDKQKDAAPFKPIDFQLVEIGGSCAVHVVGASGKKHSRTVSSGALAALRRLGQTSGLRCKDWLSASSIPPATFHRYRAELNGAGLVTKDGDLYVLTDKGQAALTLKQLSTDSQETEHTTLSHSHTP